MKWLNTMIVGVLPQWQLNINFHCIKSMEILAITLSLFWHTQNEGIYLLINYMYFNPLYRKSNSRSYIKHNYFQFLPLFSIKNYIIFPNAI